MISLFISALVDAHRCTPRTSSPLFRRRHPNSCYLCFAEFTFSLRLTEVRIPNHTVRNSTARLECHYDMDGEDLYSVKWYKDGHEFYRYLPSNTPPALVFHMPGVTVDVSNIPFFLLFFFIQNFCILFKLHEFIESKHLQNYSGRFDVGSWKIINKIPVKFMRSLLSIFLFLSDNHFSSSCTILRPMLLLWCRLVWPARDAIAARYPPRHHPFKRSPITVKWL